MAHLIGVARIFPAGEGGALYFLSKVDKLLVFVLYIQAAILN